MICRYWRGWTSPEQAPVYEALLRGTVVPMIEGRGIPGFRRIDILRRPLGEEVEFATIMWFDTIEAVKGFVGEDHEVAHVPAAARAVLSRFDERAVHFEVLEQRDQARPA
jgi:antibiotic biosynthesis monooxygenase (ABM) superfamily enzyme